MDSTLITGDLVDSLNNVDGDLMPVGSLKGDEVSKEQEEVANGGSCPCTEDWNFLECWHVEAKNSNSTWEESTLDDDVPWECTVLDTETSEESFQHGSNRVKENVEDEKLVHGQNGLLHA